MIEEIKQPQVKETTIIEVNGWQGVGDLEIVEQNKEFIILRQHHKHKETREPYYNDSKVMIEDIKFLWDLLREKCSVGETYGPHFVWRHYIRAKKLNEIEGVPEDYIVQHFLGYRQKRKGKDYYFRVYNVLKCLEKKGFLQLWGRGGIMLLNKEEFRI